MKLTISGVIDYLKHNGLSDVNRELKLKLIGEGAFRKTYKIGKLPLVIKIPKSMTCDRGHARHEARIINKITKDEKFKALRPFIPKMYYYDSKTAVIVMEYCKPMRFSNLSDEISKVFSTMVCKLFRKPKGDDSDIRGYNIGRNAKGDCKIIDLGLI